MKKCPYCAEEIQDEAVICRFCDKKQPPMPKPFVPMSKADKRFQLTIVILVLILLIICGIGFGSWGGNDQEENVDIKDSSDAWYTCQIFIERVLKAPTTADYERFNENRVYSIDANKWAVQMYVDAQNSFGAQIRSEFYCETQYFPEEDEWRLLEIDER